MITGVQVFSYIDKKVGVTQAGEQYIAMNVLSKSNRKFSFISKDPDVINKISQTNFTKFQDVKLHFDFDKEYNTLQTLYGKESIIGLANRIIKQFYNT